MHFISKVVITWFRLARMKFCPPLPGFRQCYKLFINYTLRLHVKRFILARRDHSFVQPGSLFARMNKWFQTYWYALMYLLISSDLGQRCKGLFPTFQLPPVLSHCKYKPFIKSVEFYLFCFKYWLNYFSAI